MNVLIKGMEMPTSCYACNCFIRDSDGSDYCCLLMQDIEDNGKRNDNCPLVTISSHGRLIDADVVIDRIDMNIGLYGADFPITQARMRSFIEHAPTFMDAEE